MGNRRSHVIAASAISTWAMCSLTGAVHAETPATSRPETPLTFDLNIPAGNLQDSLQAFSDHSHIRIAAFEADIEGLEANALKGNFTSEAAIERLLEGTPLRYDIIAPDLIAIARVPEPLTPESEARHTPGQDLPVPEVLFLPNIHVSGFRGSFARATRLEQQADQIVSIAASEDMSRFPDQNIAEAAARLPGVQITRRDGEGATVQIRGLSAAFTRLEVDGRRTSSSFQRADPTRESTLSIFAPDLYDTIEVIKSPRASDVEGSIGGIVRLTTKDPFAIGERALSIDVGSVIDSNSETLLPYLQMSYSDVALKNRLGVWFAGTYRERNLSDDRVENNRDWILLEPEMLLDLSDPSSLSGLRLPRRVRYFRQVGTSERYNFAGKLIYEVTPDITAYLHGLYTQETRDETRARLQVLFSDGRLTDGVAAPDGQIISSAEFLNPPVQLSGIRRGHDISTMGVSAGLDVALKRWTLNAALDLSASRETLGQSMASHDDELTTGSISYRLDGQTHIPVLNGTFFGRAPSMQAVTALSRETRQIDVDELAIALDASRPVKFGPVRHFETGIRYSSAQFSRRQGQQTLENPSGLFFSDGLPITFSDPFLVNTPAPSLPGWSVVDPYSLSDNVSFDTPLTFNDENLYDVREDVLSVYGLIGFEKMATPGLTLTGNAGVRLVGTYYSGEAAIDLAGDAIPDFGNIGVLNTDRSYLDILPSLNLNLQHEALPDFGFRFAASRVMARPDIEQIQNGAVIRIRDLTGTEPESNTLESGNPDLDPYRAGQVEAGLYWNIGGRRTSIAQLNAFAKNVENFITTITRITPYSGPVTNGETLLLYNTGFPVNGGTANVRGLEASLQTPFYFLPEPWSSFGLAMSYTYTDSDFVNADGTIQSFPGASDHAGNLIAFVDHGDFSARLGYSYRSRFLVQPARTENNTANAIYEDDQQRLDLSLRYRVNDQWRLSLDAYNLTAEKGYQYYDTPSRLARYESEGRSFLVRIDYQF